MDVVLESHYFAYNFLKKPFVVYRTDFRRRHTQVYSQKTAVLSQRLIVVGKNICFYDDVAETLGKAEGEPCLIILDDLLNEVY